MVGKDEAIKDLVIELNNLSKEYAIKNEASFESMSDFKSEIEFYDEMKVHSTEIGFEDYTLVFSFVPRSSFLETACIMYSNIFFNRFEEEDRIVVPLREFYVHFNKIPQSSLTIQYVLTKEAMKDAFASIISNYEYIRYDIEVLSANHQLVNDFVEKQNDLYGFSSFFDADIVNSDYHFRDIAILDDIHNNYVLGNFEKAKKKLLKKKKLSSNETLILNYINQADEPTIQVPQSVYEIMDKIGKGRSRRVFKKVAITLLIVIIFGTLVVGAVLVGIGLIMRKIMHANAHYVLYSLELYFVAWLLALFINIVIAYFYDNLLDKIVYGQDYYYGHLLSSIQKTQGWTRFFKRFLCFLIVVSLVFLFLANNHNLLLGENGIYDNSKFFQLKGYYHSYSDIDSVVYSDVTIEDGDEFDEPSYFIKLKSGGEIHLSTFFNTINEGYLRAFEEKGVEVKRKQP